MQPNAPPAPAAAQLIDPQTAEQAWTTYRAEAAALPDVAGRLPGYALERATFGVARRAPLLVSERAAILARLATPEADQAAAAIDRVLLLAHATYYASVRDELQTAAPAALADLDRTLEAGKALKRLGLHWLTVLVTAGVVPAEQAARIRSGTGYVDLAGDLQALGALFGAYWPVLAPLQHLQPDPPLRMTEKTPMDMSVTGTRLFDLLPQRAAPAVAPGEVDWRRELLAMVSLLERHWDAARYAAHYHFHRTDRHALVEDFTSLRGVAALEQARRREEGGEEQPPQPPSPPPA